MDKGGETLIVKQFPVSWTPRHLAGERLHVGGAPQGSRLGFWSWVLRPEKGAPRA